MVIESEFSPSPVPTEVEANLHADRKRLPGEERRAQLIEVSQPLFAEHGYHHISMEDIAYAAQVTKPVLYKHFPSKYDLYLAVIDDRAQALVSVARTEIQRVPRSSTDGFAVIKAVFNAYVHFVQDCGHNATILLESDVSRDPYIRERLAAPHRDVASMISKRLHTLSGLAHEQSRALASTVTSIAQTTALQLLRSPDQDALFNSGSSDLLAQFTWQGLLGVIAVDPQA